MFSLDRGMSLHFDHVFQEQTMSISGSKETIYFIPASFLTPVHTRVHITVTRLIALH